MRKQITVPDSLNEITLGQYQEYLKIQETIEDQNVLAMKMIEIFCGMEEDHIKMMKASSIAEVVTILSNMFDQKPSLLNRFKMGKVEYGFIPKLEDMSFGEYIDLDTYIGDFNNIHYAMNVLYRPIKQKIKSKYLIEDYTGENPDFMKQMPMDAVLGSILFFYNLGIDLSTTMMAYLEQPQKEGENLVQQAISQKDMDGIKVFGQSLRGILDDLKISLN
tara:strand:+ start:94 stop:750 length:657 start_codon:yes stop_codon:yes gene_type:complete